MVGKTFVEHKDKKKQSVEVSSSDECPDIDHICDKELQSTRASKEPSSEFDKNLVTPIPGHSECVVICTSSEDSEDDYITDDETDIYSMSNTFSSINDTDSRSAADNSLNIVPPKLSYNSDVIHSTSDDSSLYLESEIEDAPEIKAGNNEVPDIKYSFNLDENIFYITDRLSDLHIKSEANDNQSQHRASEFSNEPISKKMKISHFSQEESSDDDIEDSNGVASPCLHDNIDVNSQSLFDMLKSFTNSNSCQSNSFDNTLNENTPEESKTRSPTTVNTIQHAPSIPSVPTHINGPFLHVDRNNSDNNSDSNLPIHNGLPDVYITAVESGSRDNSEVCKKEIIGQETATKSSDNCTVDHLHPTTLDKQAKCLQVNEKYEGFEDVFIHKKVGRRIPFIHGFAKITPSKKQVVTSRGTSDNTSISTNANDQVNSAESVSTNDIMTLNEEESSSIENYLDVDAPISSNEEYGNLSDDVNTSGPIIINQFPNEIYDVGKNVSPAIELDHPYANNETCEDIIILDDSSVEIIENKTESDVSIIDLTSEGENVTSVDYIVAPSNAEKKERLQTHAPIVVYDSDGLTIDSLDRSSHGRLLLDKSAINSSKSLFEYLDIEVDDSEICVPGQPLAKHVKWFQELTTIPPDCDDYY